MALLTKYHKDMKKLLLLFTYGIIPLAGLCPAKEFYPYDIKHFDLKKRLFIETIYTKRFTPELLREALFYAEIHNPEIVYRQAVLETGNFTSDLFKYGNNLMGMRLARVRPSCATAIEYDYHATYSHWWDSVMDYKLMQDWYTAKSHDLSDYYEFLGNIGYATDKHYIVKLELLKDAV